MDAQIRDDAGVASTQDREPRIVEVPTSSVEGEAFRQRGATELKLGFGVVVASRSRGRYATVAYDFCVALRYRPTDGVTAGDEARPGVRMSARQDDVPARDPQLGGDRLTDRGRHIGRHAEEIAYDEA
jgi:hypothetical protein